MTIKYAISPYPSMLQNLVAKVYEASSPFAAVATFVLVERDLAGVPTVGAGHQVPVSITFNGLDNVTHIVRLFTASATLLHQYDENPTVDTTTVFDPIYFRIGDGGTYTPATDQPLLSNPIFSGLTAADIGISQEGLGFLLPDIDYSVIGGVISLTDTVFEDGQRWYIIRKPSVITTPVNDSVVGKGFGGFVDIVADTDYDPTHLRKLIRLSGTGNYTFPVAAAVPIGYNHVFTNFGNNPSNPQINFSNGTLLFNGAPKSFLIVPFNSTCWFTWDGTNWNCTVNSINEVAVIQPGAIVGSGNYYIGDVGSGDREYTITHGLGIGYAYRIFGTIKSEALPFKNNTLGWTAYSFLSNSFKINMQEIFSDVQDISFDYIIVKA